MAKKNITTKELRSKYKKFCADQGGCDKCILKDDCSEQMYSYQKGAADIVKNILRGFELSVECCWCKHLNETCDCALAVCDIEAYKQAVIDFIKLRRGNDLEEEETQDGER